MSHLRRLAAPALLAACSLLALAGAGCASDTDSGLNARDNNALEKSETSQADNGVQIQVDTPGVSVQAETVPKK